MTTILAAANQKGGVGKTTTSTTVGHGVALNHYRTLIIDLDPQGHVAKMLGLPKSPGVRRWYYDEEPLEQSMVQARENLWVLPTDKTIERVMGKIREDFDGVTKFAEALRNDTSSFDVVFLDLAPSLNIVQVASLLACDLAIIPTRLRSIDLDGVNEIIKSIIEISRRGQSPDYLLLPTFFDRSTRETQDLLQEVVRAFGKRVLPPIVQDTRLSEAPGRGLTVWEYAHECNALLGYPNGAGKRVGGYGYVLNQVISYIEGV